jgi:class 3 adenylate cyclase
MPRYTMERVYPLPPGEAWALLADTDHLNRMIGLPAVEFGAPRDLVRRARARFFGVPATWEEFPFEWIRERGYAVRRDFGTGPVKRFVGGVELEPDGGGTRVRVFAELTPRNVLTRPLLRFVAAPGLRRTLAYCDRYLAERADPLAPPKPAAPGRVDRNALDRTLSALGRAPVDPALVRRLEALVLRGSDDQLVRIRPYALADEWGADRYQVLRLFFHATRAGLFDLRWELMCPACRVPKGEAASLGELPSCFHCETCRIDYEVDFDERVELRFTLRPTIREAEDAVYCVGSPMRSPHIVVQQYLAPGEARAVAVPSEGPLALRAVGGADGVPLVSSGVFAWSGEVWLGTGQAPPADGEDLALRIENRGPRPLLAVVERRAPDSRAATAAEVTLLQEFRDLFGAEVLAPGQEVGVATVAVLFTDLQGSTALYEGRGDAPAYGNVRRHFDYLRDRIVAGEGAVIKTIGDAIMAAFPTPENALRAALAIQEGFAAWCRAEGIVPPMVLRIGLHSGPAVAINANQRLDYFGRTVNLAARIQRQAHGGEIALVAALWDEPAIRALAHEKGALAERFDAQLPGIEGAVELVRLWLPGPEAA